MDKVAAYEQAIISILNEYTQIKYSNVQGGNYLVADKQNHRYQVMTMGWQGHLFVHDCPIHMDIVNDKVWIFQNMTEWDLGTMLEERGVPKSDIVLGFFPKKCESIQTMLWLEHRVSSELALLRFGFGGQKR